MPLDVIQEKNLAEIIDYSLEYPSMVLAASKSNNTGGSLIDFCIPIIEALVFSMHNGKFTGPFDGFSTPDWDYIREIATKKALAMRSQGFIHPATLVPAELEYAEGYKAALEGLKKKMKPLEETKSYGNKKYEDPD